MSIAAHPTITGNFGQELFNLTGKKEGFIPNAYSLAGSNEMITLMDMTYNRDDLVGPKLIAALQSGDRLAAWYEIRFGSNKTRNVGIDNRRQAEADMFGLYEPGPI